MPTAPTQERSAVLAKLPSLLTGLSSICLAISLWHPSASSDVYMFSYFRFIAITLCISGGLYFLLSLKFKGLLGANNIVLYSIVVGLLLSEILLRLNPSFIPDNQLSLLPFSAGQEIANRRGLFTPSNVTGKGTMFHMRPGTQLPDKPWVIIDKNGFYNNVALGDQVDVVLLGASVMDARAAKQNVADMFYEAGSSAYSLAQGGPYSPFQFRDAYRQVIIEQNVSHRYVVVLIILPNEFNKIHQYQHVTASGGDYRKLFQTSITSDIVPAAAMPWTLSIVMNIFAKLPSVIEKFRRAKNLGYANVKFRDRTLKIPVSGLAVPEATERWQALGTALDGIFKDAASQGAKSLVIYYPLTPVLSIPYIEGHGKAKAKLAEYYETTVLRLEAIVRGLGGEFLDVTPKIREEQFKQDIMIKPGEYHLNQRGVKVLYSILRERLDDMGFKGN